MNPGELHGFYYTQKETDLCGLELPPVCREIMSRAVQGGFHPLSGEDYWLKLGKAMMTHCPQGYLAWEGACYWLIYNEANLHDPGQSEGVHLVRFSADRTLGYRWLNPPDYKSIQDPDFEDLEGDALGGALYRFVYTPWDWLLDGEGDDAMFPLDDDTKKAIEGVTGWTNALHQTLAKKYPPKQYWT